MLQLFDIRKSYTTADFTQTALDDVSIAFRDNEFVAILGPSGSGKTTLLNIVGGLDHYDSGNLVIDGISTEQYKDRDWDTYRNNRIGFVFQSYNLIPHQTVLSNVELALTLSGVSRGERKERAKQALIEVGLGDHINKKPSQLSGGQMQRVAVARALINDPEILLADEPTGALDSKTSVQIMELLTQIAKDRLVIMVTHNPELAETYSTRIVNLRDGQIIDDTNPFEPALEEEKASGKEIRRTSMSFLTAISLSFNNLMTKKGRTIMTAFAGSIGIIGIAAILALANGVNNYIKSVEEDTLTVYPLTIENTGYDLTGMMSSMMGSPEDEIPEDHVGEDGESRGTITETKALTNMFKGIGTNDLKSLKSYLDSGESDIDQYSNLVAYSYGLTPLVYSTETEGGVRQVNPNTAFKALTSGGAMSGSAGAYASMMTSGSSTDVFAQMLDNPSLLENQYDVIAGRWPDKYDECVLVLNYEGGVNDVTLYAMGLRDPEELEKMVDEIANNEEVETPLDQLEFSYEDIMDVSFKLVIPAETYVKDETHNIWVSKTDDNEFMTELVNRSEELDIVGIVQINENAAASSLMPGIAYRSDLQLHIIEKSAQTAIVQEQRDNPELNVISGRTFEEEKNDPDRESLDFSSMISVDEDKIASAFSIDANALQVDSSGLSNLNFDAASASSPNLPAPDLATLLNDVNLDLDISSDQVNAIMSEILQGFFPYYLSKVDPNEPFDQDLLIALFNEYLNTPEVQAMLVNSLSQLVDSDAILAQLQDALQNYMQTAMQAYIGSLMANLQQQVSSAMNSTMTSLSANMANAMNIDQDKFIEAFQFNMDEKEIQELMMSLMTSDIATYDKNLKSFGYADLDNPARIDIYPIDFASKEEIIAILDGYNERMESSGEEDKVIVYTDIVGALMSSVTDIVNMVSYVLVAFVAISLVVSSIMIGIITYISVLERRKEIGILRSIGASKRDISSVFNAETLIVGFVAGVIGIGLTALTCIPVNVIVYEGFGVPDVASLPLNAGLVLVLISMFLSFIAGLIPSSAASRKDPVEALRSE